MSEPEPWVSGENVARHLGTSKVTVYRRMEARSLPVDEIGRLWKLELSDIGEWVRAGGAGEDPTGGTA